MRRMARPGYAAGVVVALFTALLASACTTQVSGDASPDPAVTIVTKPTVSAPSTTTRTRTTTVTKPPTTTVSATSSRTLLCALARATATSTTSSINVFNDVYNAQKSVTPELIQAEAKFTAELTPVPAKLRSLAGIASLPPTDPLVTVIPAFAAAVEQILASVPLRQAAPFNAGTKSYNTQLDALKATCS